jgi:predicted O-methyltransferase YrrM
MNPIPQGFLLSEDVEFLLELSIGASLAVDLGTCAGKSAYVLSQTAARVITVDLFERFESIPNEGSRAHYAKVFEDVRHTFDTVKTFLSQRPNIEVVQAFTHEHATTQSDLSVDLLFIDADHSYKGVKRDFDAWFPKVKNGGVICFHDYNTDNWDVGAFIENEIVKHPALCHIDNKGVVSAWKKYTI